MFAISAGMMVCAPMVITSVWPSGAALATTLVPTVPTAPGRFSITIGWPSFSCSCAATSLAITSTEPPGGKGTINRTVRVG